MSSGAVSSRVELFFLVLFIQSIEGPRVVESTAGHNLARYPLNYFSHFFRTVYPGAPIKPPQFFSTFIPATQVRLTIYMFWWSTTYLAMLPGVTSFSACSSGICTNKSFLKNVCRIAHLKTKFILNGHDHFHMVQAVKTKVL